MNYTSISLLSLFIPVSPSSSSPPSLSPSSNIDLYIGGACLWNGFLRDCVSGGMLEHQEVWQCCRPVLPRVVCGGRWHDAMTRRDDAMWTQRDPRQATHNGMWWNLPTDHRLRELLIATAICWRREEN